MIRHVSTHPPRSLSRVLEDLGPTLLDLLHGDITRAPEVGGVVIHDPYDEQQYPAHAIVLGPGARGTDGIARLLGDLSAHRAAALVVRGPVEDADAEELAAAAAISLGACSIINVKPARVGGYLEARRIHDLARAHGIPVWCGGMLETGIGRAANVALAALPGFTLPGDTSGSHRYFATDITEPFVLDADGHLDVPTGPGLGVEPLRDVLEEITVSSEWIAL